MSDINESYLDNIETVTKVTRRKTEDIDLKLVSGSFTIGEHLFGKYSLQNKGFVPKIDSENGRVFFIIKPREEAVVFRGDPNRGDKKARVFSASALLKRLEEEEIITSSEDKIIFSLEDLGEFKGNKVLELHIEEVIAKDEDKNEKEEPKGNTSKEPVAQDPATGDIEPAPEEEGLSDDDDIFG